MQRKTTFPWSRRPEATRYATRYARPRLRQPATPKRQRGESASVAERLRRARRPLRQSASVASQRGESCKRRRVVPQKISQPSFLMLFSL